MANFFGFFNNKNSDEFKNAERVQNYLNKFKQQSREVSSGGEDNSDYRQNQLLSSMVEISNERRLRYKEYREMCRVPELNLGLNVYSDNATQYNIENNVLEIQSENNKVMDILHDLFFERLDINSNLWKMTRNMCKLGDEFLEVTVDHIKNPKHITSLERFKRPERIRRVEKKGVLRKFVYESERDVYTKKTISEKTFHPWRIVHLRIEEEDFDPYGKSILEAGRQTWKKLALMEDAMLIYRISRAPERRVFYIDVGTMSTKEANKSLENIKRRFRKKPFINPTTGQIDEKANPLAIDEDFYIAVRQNTQGTRIETLPAGQNLNEIDDVKYFRDAILKTMGIPPAYLGSTEAVGGYDPKSFLSQQDIQFSRTIERIQKFIVKGLEKIAILELIFQGIEPEELNNFKIMLTPPSNVDQLMEIEIRNQQFGLISNIKQIGGESGPFLPDDWIYRKILGLSDQEINKIKLQIQMQLQMQAQIQALYGAQEGGGGGGAVGGGMEALGGNIAGGEVPAGEAGGPEGEAPEGGTPEEAGLEIASKSIEFDGGKWLIERQSDMEKILKYVNLYEKVHKDNNKKKVKTENKNSLTRMTIKGEFRGLLTASYKYSTKNKTLIEFKNTK